MANYIDVHTMKDQVGQVVGTSPGSKCRNSESMNSRKPPAISSLSISIRSPRPRPRSAHDRTRFPDAVADSAADQESDIPRPAESRWVSITAATKPASCPRQIGQTHSRSFQTAGIDEKRPGPMATDNGNHDRDRRRAQARADLRMDHPVFRLSDAGGTWRAQTPFTPTRSN